MTNPVITNVLATYADEQAYDQGILRLEEDPLPAAYGQALIRLYFKGAMPSLLSTSGFPVNVVVSNVTSDHQEVLFFQGTNVASFSRPVVSQAKVSQVGRFLDLNGRAISTVNLTVNELTGQVMANQPCYGTVQTTYRSTYTRLQAAYQRLTDPTLSKSDFAPMVIVAISSNGGRDSLPLEPPDRLTGGGYNGFDRTSGENLIMELDPQFPVALSHNDARSNLAAVARILVYSYGDSVKMSATQGAISITTQAKTLEITEGISFSGSQSTSVRYPPIRGISVTAQGNFQSRFAPSFSPRFVTGPGLVNTVDWIGYQQYRLTGNRDVQANEVAVTSGGSILIPSTGLARAKYSTRRTSYTLRWTRTSTGWFDPVVVLASDVSNRTGTITVNPPTRRGV